jgi:hypothetical protein
MLCDVDFVEGFLEDDDRATIMTRERPSSVITTALEALTTPPTRPQHQPSVHR